MKRIQWLTMTVLAVLLLAVEVQARSIWALIAVVKETKTAGQNFEPNSQSAGNIGGSGHQMANLPNIGQGIGKGKDGDGGLPIDLAGFQTQSGNTTTNTASLESAIDLIRANQSDVTRAGGDATQSDTGDKNRAGPSMNAAVTGQGVSAAQQTQPNAQGAPVSTQTVQVNKAQLEEFQAQALANKAALDAAQATEARLRAEAAQMQDDIQRLHKLYSPD